MTRRVVTVLLVLALAGGCTRGGGTGADPTLPPETSASTAPSTSTSAVPEVNAIPANIDEAYLDRVLAALDEIDGRATRIIVERKRLVPEATDLLASIYDGESFTEQTSLWQAALDRDPQLSNFKPSPGNVVTKVSRIISRSSLCVWMEVRRDYSSVGVAAVTPKPEYVALRALAESRPERHINPTAWIISYDGYLSDRSEPEDQCAGA